MQTPPLTVLFPRFGAIDIDHKSTIDAMTSDSSIRLTHPRRDVILQGEEASSGTEGGETSR